MHGFNSLLYKYRIHFVMKYPTYVHITTALKYLNNYFIAYLNLTFKEIKSLFWMNGLKKYTLSENELLIGKSAIYIYSYTIGIFLY